MTDSTGTPRDFDRVYAAHHRAVLSLSARFVGSQDAPDVSQRVWLRVARRLETFRGDCALSSWLWRVTYTTSVDYLRRQRCHTDKIDQFTVVETLEREAPGLGPDECYARAEQEQAFVRALGTLRSEEQAAILAYRSGLTLRECAELFGIPESTVKTRIYRLAVPKLRRCLRRH